jgi:hypothetical protein
MTDYVNSFIYWLSLILFPHLASIWYLLFTFASTMDICLKVFNIWFSITKLTLSEIHFYGRLWKDKEIKTLMTVKLFHLWIPIKSQNNYSLFQRNRIFLIKCYTAMNSNSKWPGFLLLLLFFSKIDQGLGGGGTCL